MIASACLAFVKPPRYDIVEIDANQTPEEVQATLKSVLLTRGVLKSN